MLPLTDLLDNIAAQEEAITQISSGLKSTDKSDSWSEFKESLWGKDLGSVQKVESVKRDELGPVEDVALPDEHIVAILPETLPGDGWILQNEWILVRSEYSEAEQAAVSCSKSYLDAFMVSGQPGIGPPPFPFIAHRI